MQLSLVELERRELLSAAVTLNQGVLSIVADNAGDNIIVQNQNQGQTVEVLVADENGQQSGRTVDFAAAQVTNILFQGGNGTLGDYFANLTSVPSTQRAGNNPGTNYLQGGKGNDNLIADGNPAAKTYLTDPSGTNTFRGGPGFVNYFAGTGSNTFTLGSGYTALYSITATANVITGRSAGTGYLIVNNGTQITNAAGYQIITFFQPGVSGTAAGSPNGPSAILQPDRNGNNILYLNAANGQAATTFVVNPIAGAPAGAQVNYVDSSGNQLNLTFFHVSWIASFGPRGSNNTEINNTAINDVLYGGLPPGNHLLVGGFGINVLKGHSGLNTLVARGYYNDVSAGAGTDLIVDDHSQAAAITNAVFASRADVFRANQTTVSSTILGFSPGDVVSGTPLSLNGFTDPFDTDTTADNEDYTLFAAVLRQRGGSV